jgi:hypothetical protein
VFLAIAAASAFDLTDVLVGALALIVIGVVVLVRAIVRHE